MTRQKEKPEYASLRWREPVQGSQATAHGRPNEDGFYASSWRSQLGEQSQSEDAVDASEVNGDDSMEDPYRFRSIRVPLNVLKKWLLFSPPSSCSAPLVDTRLPGAISALAGRALDPDADEERQSGFHAASAAGQFRLWHVALWVLLAIGMGLLLGTAFLIALPPDRTSATPLSAQTPAIGSSADRVTAAELVEPRTPADASPPPAEAEPKLPAPRSLDPIRAIAVPNFVAVKRRAGFRVTATRPAASRVDKAAEPGSGLRLPSTGSKEDAGTAEEAWTALHDPPED
jgi:hypothetical protein